MFTYTGPICREGRKEQSLQSRVNHFAKCQHPQCLALWLYYKGIAYRTEQLEQSEKDSKKINLTNQR